MTNICMEASSKWWRKYSDQFCTSGQLSSQFSSTSSLIWLFIFILLSRDSDGGAMHRTNPDSLRRCRCFRVFRLSFASALFDLLLVRFYQAQIIIMKHLIHWPNNEAWVGVEHTTGLAIMTVVIINDTSNYYNTLPTLIFQIFQEHFKLFIFLWNSSSLQHLLVNLRRWIFLCDQGRWRGLHSLLHLPD